MLKLIEKRQKTGRTYFLLISRSMVRLHHGVLCKPLHTIAICEGFLIVQFIDKNHIFTYFLLYDYPIGYRNGERYFPCCLHCPFVSRVFIEFSFIYSPLFLLFRKFLIIMEAAPFRTLVVTAMGAVWVSAFHADRSDLRTFHTGSFVIMISDLPSPPSVHVNSFHAQSGDRKRSPLKLLRRGHCAFVFKLSNHCSTVTRHMSQLLHLRKDTRFIAPAKAIIPGFHSLPSSLINRSMLARC